MEIAIVFLALATAALFALTAAARAAITVCAIDVRDGRIEVRRGGIAPRLLADLGDVVARPPVRSATIVITRSRGRAEIEMKGDLSEAQRQRVRNVVGSVPLAQLGNARRRR